MAFVANTCRFVFPGLRHRRLLLGCLIAVVWATANGDLTADDSINFGRKIRPILAEHCLACHGFDSSTRKADLRLDLRESAIDSGAIDPEQPENSLLLDRIFSDDPDFVMPPPSTKKALTAEQKDLLKKWIEQSAKYEEHWAFEAPQKPSLPRPKDPNWPKNEIDYFVLKVLEENNLNPAPTAEPANLFRRIHLDITGLPPKVDDLNRFLIEYQADSEQALSKWIDRLMERPAWGEHRGRYWLDLARYSDTHGMHFDNYREMWPYRDWVIRAFNANQPYDQFMIEQIAGDLLVKPSTDQLIATGFQRCNITTNEGGTIEDENLALYAADRVQTFGWAFLGLTLNCAQCHDHKFDAVTTKEYYSMAAFFRNTTQRGLDGNAKDGASSVLHLPIEADLARWNALPAEIASAKAELEQYRTAAYEKFAEGLKSVDADSLKQTVRQADLELHVPFTDGSGEQAQTSRGTSIASLGQPTWNPDGKFGPAATITQPTSFLVGDVGGWEFDQSFSYGAWIKPADRNGSGAIIARMDTANRFRGWDLMQQSTRLSVHLIDSWSDNSIKVRTEQEVVAGDRWQHVFVTYDGTRRPEGIKIFVDGVSQPITVDNHSLKEGATLRTPTPARLGQRRSDNYWNGTIQELRMYRCALSEQEVADIVYRDELGLLLSLEVSKRTPERIKQAFDLLIPSVDADFKKISQQHAELEREHNEIRMRSPITHIQQENMDSQPETSVLMRGEYDKLGELVKAGTPGLLHPFSDSLPRNRLGLAKWLVDPRNPVTARVTVNRFWQEVFGQGLVATVEDFGVMGTPPTHPELLDWLAIDFQENGWNIKRFYKQVLMSATYRQSAQITKEKLELDLSNALLSRGPRFRMDGEMIRDFALSTSGLLSTQMYGPGAKPYQPENLWNIVGLPEGNTRDYQQDTGENLYRRSLYSFWKRMAHPPNLEIFNAPSREVCVVKRERTNTPLQALVTLNDPLFVEAARNLAQRSLKSLREIEADSASRSDDSLKTTSVKGSNSSEKSVREILNRIALIALGRKLSEQESELLTQNYNEYLAHYESNLVDAQALLKTGESPVDGKIEAQKLAAWTMVCQQFLNLDEAITK